MKPTTTRFTSLGSLMTDKYNTPFPMLFDDSLTQLEKMNKIVTFLVRMSENFDVLGEQWNDVTAWLMNEGLEQAVIDEIKAMKKSGELSAIINQELVNQLHEDVARNVSNLTFKTDGYNMPSANNGGAIISFIDDDGHKDVLKVLKPIFDEKGMPFSSAIITSYPNNQPDYMTWSEILQLQASGVEIMSHTHTHSRLGSLSPSQQIEEFRRSKEELLKRGIYPNHIVYPQGDYNNNTMENVIGYYRSGIATQISSQMDGHRAPITEGKVARISLGSWQTLSTSEIISKIDNAVATGKWIIFTTHIWANNHTNPSEGNVQAIKDVLNYCVNHTKVQVLKYNDAFKRFTNRLMLGNNNITNKPYYIIGSDYQIYTNQNQLKSKLQKTTLGFEALPSEYDKITNDIVLTFKEMTAYEATESAQAPVKKAGILITEKIRLRHGYAKQTFKVYEGDDVYTRTGKNDDTWGAWYGGINVGNTASRPTNPRLGEMYWDNTLAKPIWWSGSRWRDAMGTEMP